MRCALFVSLALPLVACKAPPEAPSEFADIAAFLFERFDDEDTQDIALGVENLEAWLLANLDATEGDSLADGYTVSSLDPAVIRTVRPDSEPAVDSEIAGSSVAGELTFDVPTLAQAIAIEEQEEIFKAYVTHERTFLTDESCFVTRGCETLDTLNNVHSSFAGGTLQVTSEGRAQFRWLDYGDDQAGKTALLRRTWLLEPPKMGGAFASALEINEQIYVGVLLPWEGGTLRIATTWVSVNIVGDIDEGFALQMMVSSMQNENEQLTEYLGGPTTPEPTE